ncbi:NBR1-Ig-like domain-containing protein [Psychrobacter sp. I-STPA6b]|uniref:NBR1-Ig-like domain-containing protein n=1 Tax=Psychrobacter sp. I-STPA6b TaxID=2585718 RepID=UPI001D0C071D|nr:NBR1-Ig-like domain-containing protein [Psychrobacter sp. I-STPA6b]
MSLEHFITEFCKKHQITKEQLAKTANISRSTLYRMMEKDKSPTLINLTKVAIAMQVHPQYLIKIEWEKYQLSGYDATPINPLTEPMRWFQQQAEDSSHFISETVPDGSLVCVNERFCKTWRIQNTGNTQWSGRKLQCQQNNDFLQQQASLQPFTKEYNFHITPLTNIIDIPDTKPGETVDLSVAFIAPSIPTTVFSYWKMVDETGQLCFPNSIGVYLQVQVVSAGSAQSN